VFAGVKQESRDDLKDGGDDEDSEQALDFGRYFAGFIPFFEQQDARVVDE
jgi:hypothetical protein